MAQIWRVNENNDIEITGGRLAIARDLQAVLQQCEQAMKAQLNEMIYANNRGVNTFQSVWDGSPNLLSFEAFARAQLDRVPNVENVEQFSAQLVGNTLEYVTTIRTAFGTGTAAGSMNG